MKKNISLALVIAAFIFISIRLILLRSLILLYDIISLFVLNFTCFPKLYEPNIVLSEV